LLDDVRQALVEMLAAEGVKANVAAVPYSDKLLRDKLTAMSFTITAPAVRFGPVRIEGASEAFLPKVQRIADFAGENPFDSETSVAKLERNIVSFYEDHGYAAVKVQAEQSGMPVSTADSIQVPYKVTVQEGKTYKLGLLRLPPGAFVTQEDFSKVLNPNTNTFMRPSLGALLMVIDNCYKAKGYLDLAVTLHPQFDDTAAIVNYTIDIDPSAVYHVAYVKFDGVSDALRSQLMRAWELMPGEPFDEPYLSRFISKVESQDPVLKRELVGMLAKYDITADPMTHEVNVVIRLEK
jgi:outer membrane translocation and assembly module TamA